MVFALFWSRKMCNNEWKRSVLPEYDQRWELVWFRRVRKGEFSNVKNENPFKSIKCRDLVFI
jgi:hypothetical protein